MDVNTPVKLPQFNWDKILTRAAILMLFFTSIALISRWRTLMVVAELVNALVILGLLFLGAYALIAKSTENTDKKSK